MKKATAKDDKVLCREIKESIGGIIKLSVNEEFRQKCFNLAQATGRYDLEQKIFNQLTAICEGKLHGKRAEANKENAPASKPEEATPVKETVAPDLRTNWLQRASKSKRSSVDLSYVTPQSTSTPKRACSPYPFTPPTFMSTFSQATSSYDHVKKTLFDEEDDMEDTNIFKLLSQ